MRDFNKIFCIGLNKTGTVSLHYALKSVGLASLHWAPDRFGASIEGQAIAEEIKTEMAQNIEADRPLLGRWDGYDAYSDIHHIIHHFDLADRHYPGSLFIFTDRDEDAWIKSRRNHVERNIENYKKGHYAGAFLEVNEEKWRAEWRSHRERVMQHFCYRRDDLLVLNVCDGEGFEKLGPFLGVERWETGFPKRNVTDL